SNTGAPADRTVFPSPTKSRNATSSDPDLTGKSMGEAPRSSNDLVEGVSFDDETIDDDIDPAELLSSALGAELISEEDEDV
ncbi:MAG: hypothetical protein FWD80_03670, partial [Propionibacteriaceae bacterium]|nr:hypothetical protein [Propionibacteriaceae bacterium]